MCELHQPRYLGLSLPVCSITVGSWVLLLLLLMFVLLLWQGKRGGVMVALGRVRLERVPVVRRKSWWRQGGRTEHMSCWQGAKVKNVKLSAGARAQRGATQVATGARSTLAKEPPAWLGHSMPVGEVVDRILVDF